MTPEPSSPLVDLAPLGWSASRVAAAMAVAAANSRRIAQAGRLQLTLDDHAYGFASWCDVQAHERGVGRPQR